MHNLLFKSQGHLNLCEKILVGPKSEDARSVWVTDCGPEGLELTPRSHQWLTLTGGMWLWEMDLLRFIAWVRGGKTGGPEDPLRSWRRLRGRSGRGLSEGAAGEVEPQRDQGWSEGSGDSFLNHRCWLHPEAVSCLAGVKADQALKRDLRFTKLIV